MTRSMDDAKRRDWQARFERFRNSDLTIGRFCSAERVSINSFYYWAKRLESPSAPPALQTGSRRRRAATQAGGGHAASRSADSNVLDTANPTGAVRFLLGDGVEIVVPAERLDVVRCLVRCLRRRTATTSPGRAAGSRSAAFQEVVVAAH